MAKPSIFSKKYDRTRRRRKFLKQLAIVILLLVALFFLFRNPIMDKVNKVRQDIIEEEMVVNAPNQDQEIDPEEKPIETPVEEEILLTFMLEDETEFIFEMEKEGEDLLFKLPTERPNYEIDRSPNKTQLVILDEETQELYLANANGDLRNITYRIYENSKGYTESKESILNRKDNFVWAEQPRFLNEETVVYMSQLPWFDERRFLYIVELDPLSHRNFQSVFGRDLTLKELEEKGLAYEKADKTYYFTSDFKIITP